MSEKIKVMIKEAFIDGCLTSGMTDSAAECFYEMSEWPKKQIDDGWISVDDKLPLSIEDFSGFSKPIIGNLTKDVLVTDGVDVWLAGFMMWFDNKVSGHHFSCIGNPTHWMPLPNPPDTK